MLHTSSQIFQCSTSFTFFIFVQIFTLCLHYLCWCNYILFRWYYCIYWIWLRSFQILFCSESKKSLKWGINNKSVQSRILHSATIKARSLVYSLFGLMVAHLQRGVIINKRSFKLIHSDSVDAALFTVELDPVEVDHCRENSQLHITLRWRKGDKSIKRYIMRYTVHFRLKKVTTLN